MFKRVLHLCGRGGGGEGPAREHTTILQVQGGQAPHLRVRVRVPVKPIVESSGARLCPPIQTSDGGCIQPSYPGTAVTRYPGYSCTSRDVVSWITNMLARRALRIDEGHRPSHSVQSAFTTIAETESPLYCIMILHTACDCCTTGLQMLERSPVLPVLCLSAELHL